MLACGFAWGRHRKHTTGAGLVVALILIAVMWIWLAG
jgi:hypothetical protein